MVGEYSKEKGIEEPLIFLYMYHFSMPYPESGSVYSEVILVY
jgi:hypothetical protein